MFCTNCGKEIDNGATTCPNCNSAVTPITDTPQQAQQAQPTQQPQQPLQPQQPTPYQSYQQQPQQPEIEDKVNVGFIILSLLIPIAGIILFAINLKKTPKSAKIYLFIALAAWALNLIVTFLCMGSFYTEFFSALRDGDFEHFTNMAMYFIK